MSSIHLTLEQKNKLWNQAKNELGGVSLICDICGGSSTAFCQCAYQDFLKDPVPIYNTLVSIDEKYKIGTNISKK